MLLVTDPSVLAGARDDRCQSVACLVARSHGSVLTARGAACVWTAGAAVDGRGCLSAWSAATGALVAGAALEAAVSAIAVVETVRPAGLIRAPPPPPRARGAAATDSFGCELLLWAGLEDGRIAVLASAELQRRATLTAHHGAVTCVCAPGAPPAAPNQGASIVLSGGADCCMLLWDARTAEQLRSLQCGGAVLCAMIALWSAPAGGRDASCRVWSAASNQTLAIWEPRPARAQGWPRRAAGDRAPRERVRARRIV